MSCRIEDNEQKNLLNKHDKILMCSNINVLEANVWKKKNDKTQHLLQTIYPFSPFFAYNY